MDLQYKRAMASRLRGQGLSDYLVIVGMIVVAGIVVIGVLGDILNGQVSYSTNKLTNGQSRTSIAATKTGDGADGAIIYNDLGVDTSSS